MMALVRLYLKIKHGISRRLAPWFYTKVARVKLRAVGAKVGNGFWADGKIRLSTGQFNITIGDHVRLRSRYRGNLVGMAFPITFQSFNRTGKISIGDHCGLSAVVISSMSEVRIGRNVILGGNVRIFDHDYHSLDATYRRDRSVDRKHVKTAPVVIDDDVFVGTGALILKGVHVGARSVIGAGSVVSMKQIPPDSIVAGNPAKIIRTKSVAS
jgi:acetyltransferase-like isoleucine patch superfamily enzyme